MQYEIALMLMLLMLSAFGIRDRKRLAMVWGGVFLFFIYIHRALLPFIVSGLYFFFIIGIIDCIVFLDIKNITRPARVFINRLYGMLARGLLPCTAVTVLIVMIQLCRMNISIDYDSLRYGLRSDVLLSDNGIRGFFEGMGLVNLVYTYPKGFELITLPLNFGHTYGYVLSFNIWVFIAILMLSGETVRVLCGGSDMRAFAFTAMLTALIPGISNMALTAKSDLMTLFCQLIFILCLIKYLAEGNTRKYENDALYRALSGIGTGALLMSFSFKPTALVFSSVTGLCAAAFLIIKRKHVVFNAKGIRAALLLTAFTALITLRTFLISGQPVTSVFSGGFDALGFKLRYPFMAQTVINDGNSSFTVDRIELYLSRLIHFILCPTGADMEHVIMAWGGLIFIVMFFAAVIMYKRTSRNIESLMLLRGIGAADRENKAAAEPYISGTEVPSEITAEPEAKFGADAHHTAWELLNLLLAAVTVLSLCSLWLLYQVDGNYFELWYLLAVISGGTAIAMQLSYEGSVLQRNEKRLLGGSSGLGIIALSAVSVYITAFTGWSGAAGFTPADFVNRGYYNHEAEYGIKNPLGWDKHTRVAAFAGEPECYLLKGRVESYVDITGSCGNVSLVKSLNAFKEYLSFADIDYIYADLDYLKDSTDTALARASELFRDLTEDGDFEEMVLEENSSSLLYCRIDKERASVGWEAPMTEEQREHAMSQTAFYEELTGSKR